MVSGINHLTFAVSNLKKSFGFYVEVLSFRPIAKWETGAYLTTGETWIALTSDPAVAGAVRPDYSHIALTCAEAGFDTLKNKILEYGCEEWSENKSEGDSFYFRDPDGHKLELHVGGLNSRIESMKKNPWGDIQFWD